MCDNNDCKCPYCKCRNKDINVSGHLSQIRDTINAMTAWLVAVEATIIVKNHICHILSQSRDPP